MINAGEALPQLVIFEVKYTNSAWIPSDMPPNWRFSTSNSGWTSNSHGFEWLSTFYDPYPLSGQGGSLFLGFLIFDLLRNYLTGLPAQSAETEIWKGWDRDQH